MICEVNICRILTFSEVEYGPTLGEVFPVLEIFYRMKSVRRFSCWTEKQGVFPSNAIGNEFGRRSRAADRGRNGTILSSADLERLAPDEAKNVLDGVHRPTRQFLGASRAVREDCVDRRGIGLKPFHLGANRAKLRDGQINQSCFEG